MQFVHKFCFPVPVDGLSADWQIAEIEGEADCQSLGSGWYVSGIRVYALGSRIPGEMRCESKMHPLPTVSRLGEQIVRWLHETQAEDIKTSYYDATTGIHDAGQSYEDEHRLSYKQVA